MKEFARAVLSKQEDQLTCSACEAVLAEYVDAQIMGVEPPKGSGQVALHLQVCPHCARAYRELIALVTSAYTEKTPRPARRPEFDFSFLEREEVQPEKPFWDELRRLVAEVPILIGETVASFGQLPPPLAPRLVPAGAYRKREPIPGAEKEEEEVVELLEIPHRDDNLVIRLRLGPVFDGKGTLVLEVGTLEPSQPIEQAKVTLRDEDGGLLEGTPTDEDGLAFFRELDLGKYIVQVEHAGQTWEFGVTLAPVVG